MYEVSDFYGTLGVIRDIICRLTGARASIRPPGIHRGPRTVPKILSQWSSGVILGLGILPEHGLGILTVPWMAWTNKAPWDYLVHGPKGKGEQIHVHYFFGTGTHLWVGTVTFPPRHQPLGICCSRRIKYGWQAIASGQSILPPRTFPFLAMACQCVYSVEVYYKK